MSNVFGKLFKISSFGESHGNGLGVVIDGCPSNFKIDFDAVALDLNRRKPGQSKITTQRKEEDEFEILSGVFKGYTTGAPIAILVRNKNHHSQDYDNLESIYRPSHADFTIDTKFGHRDHRGGGRTSARIMIARVIAGSIAKQILAHFYDIEILSFVRKIHDLELDDSFDINSVNLKDIESNIVRCPDRTLAKLMIKKISQAKDEGDSLGGVISTVVKNMIVGLGQPEFDKLPSRLAEAMLSINATKGFEIGSGFEGTNLSGSEHNDEILEATKLGIKTVKNNAGGVLGGISNGENLYFNVSFKPTASISKSQRTVNRNGQSVDLKIEGRHDPCVLPRAVVIVEAMTALVLLDLALVNNTYNFK
jgi:chorismate synthase